MLDGFMCQPRHTEMLNLAPARQNMSVLDIGMAQVKSCSFDDLQGRDRCIAHAALLCEKRGRRPEHRRQRSEASHQRLGKRLGVAALSSSLARMRLLCPDIWSAGLSAGADLEETGTIPKGIAQKA